MELNRGQTFVFAPASINFITVPHPPVCGTPNAFLLTPQGPLFHWQRLAPSSGLGGVMVCDKNWNLTSLAGMVFLSFISLSPLCCCLCVFSASFSFFSLPAVSAQDKEFPSAPPSWEGAKGLASLPGNPLSCSHLSTVLSAAA